MVVVNPEWRDAPYECAFIVYRGKRISEPFPFRFRTERDARFFQDKVLSRVAVADLKS
jgi:hypothetical protein